MISLEQFGGVNVLQGFPGVVAFGVALPLDQVTNTFRSFIFSMTDDPFHGVFFFPVDHVRRWPGIVGSVCHSLVIGHEEGRMEHIVDTP